MTLALAIGWAIAAATGAAAAWIFERTRTHFCRPILRAVIDHELGSLVETETTDGLQKQKYARIIVHNDGLTMAKNCCACIDFIKREDPRGSNYAFRSDLIDLNWAVSSSSKNIPSRSYKILDVVHTQISKNEATRDTAFYIDGRIPYRLARELKAQAGYELHVLIYADNAAPTDISCRINVGSDWTELHIEPCSDPRPR